MKIGLFAALLLALLVPLIAEDNVPYVPYVPLTQAEAAAYVARFPADAAADIIKLDAIEHAPPAVTLPRGILVTTDTALAWSWAGPLELSIGAGAATYAITLPPAKVNRPPPAWWPVPAAAVGGLIVGLVAGLLIHP